MKLLDLVLPYCLLNVVLTNAVNVDFNGISECVLSCLVETFSAAKCSLIDTSCQCDDKQLAYSTSQCLLQKCPLADSLALGRLRDRLCGRLPETRQQSMLGVNLGMGITSTAVVAARFLSRFLVSKNVWLDDYFILMAVIVNVSSIVTGAWMQIKGLGKHIWYIPTKVVPEILRLYYVSESLYLMILLLTKTSILLFYLRIFPRRHFQIATYAMLAFVGLSGVVILLLQILQCLPIAYNWDRSLKGAECLNINALTYTHAGISVLQDFAILGFPVRQLISLKMAKRQKVEVIFVFQLGLFACVTSIVRLRSLIRFNGAKSIDPTWDYVDATIWSSAEMNTGIICCSLPAVRALMKPISLRSFRVAWKSTTVLVQGTKVEDHTGSNPLPKGPVSNDREIDQQATRNTKKLNKHLDKPLHPTPMSHINQEHGNNRTYSHRPHEASAEFMWRDFFTKGGISEQIVEIYQK